MSFTQRINLAEWFEEYQANFSEYENNKGALLSTMANHKFDICDDLLCNDGLLTKALIARQLMYEIACDFCEITGYKMAS